MLLSKLIGERYKETPSEATIPSHIFLLKGGYMRQITNGVYTLLPPAQRVVRKLENIMREEMDGIDGQEVKFPVVMPRSLWTETGRDGSSELVHFKDRKGTEMLIGLSHEEAAVHLSRTEIKSYQQMPLMIYQFQTKFRDEARSRGGLIRVREFTMKDGYSYHTDEKDMEEYYKKAYHAYERIYTRVGLPEVVAVESDNGIMGGDISHEFMLISDSGEDILVFCDRCDYSSNMETAISKPIYLDINDNSHEEINKHETPNITTIDGLAKHFNVKEESLVKSAVFGSEIDKNPIIVFLRGDREVNEAKLRNHIGGDIFPWEGEAEGVVLGYLGPVGLNSKNVKIFFDGSLEGGNNLIAGGNEIDCHISNLSMKRDVDVKTFFDFSRVKEGESCTKCAEGKLVLKRGIEVGNIFQLGDSYTKSLGHTYTAEDGKEKHPIMGCYGIGVGRLLASIIEAKHDEYGPVWPYSVAPWQIQICALNQKKEGVKELAEEIYNRLRSQYEVIFDDRDAQPGIQFADADLLGVPIRLIISPRNIKNNQVEIVTRDKKYKELVDLSDLDKVIKTISLELKDKIR